MPREKCRGSGKVIYTTFYAASQDLRRMTKRTAESVAAYDCYECPHCKMWHIGHRSKGRVKIDNKAREEAKTKLAAILTAAHAANYHAQDGVYIAPQIRIYLPAKRGLYEKLVLTADILHELGARRSPTLDHWRATEVQTSAEAEVPGG